MQASSQDSAADSADGDDIKNGVLLFVDDEPSILQALRRLFHRSGYRLLVAESGAAALDLLEQEAVDLVLTDMRMPEMDGASLLEQIRSRWPDTVRVLLTGHADLDSTIDAINRGGVYRYVSKPWNDDELRAIVRDGVAMGRLVRENRRLVELTQRQNGLLRELNATLEARVAQRTQELSAALEGADAARGSLKRSFLETVNVLSGLVEMREKRRRGHSRLLADTARAVGREMGLDEAALQDIGVAARLRDIGKIGLPDGVVRKPELELSDEERVVIRQHPVTGELLLMSISSLHQAASLIRHHHERFDGQGYPDGLRGDQIPLGARIITAVNDYFSQQNGEHSRRPMSAAEVRKYLQDGAGSRYDPKVVRAFLRVVPQEPAAAPESSAARAAIVRPVGPGVGAPKTSADSAALVDARRPGSLRAGMVVQRDLMHPDGYLLLSAGFVLNDHVLARLRRLEQTLGMPLTVMVEPASGGGRA